MMTCCCSCVMYPFAGMVRDSISLSALRPSLESQCDESSVQFRPLLVSFEPASVPMNRSSNNIHRGEAAVYK